MSPAPLNLIQQIHSAGVKLVYEFTGAGSLALTWLHSVGGSSRTVLEATDRYAPASLADLLGHPPAKPVSPATAGATAAAAHLRALRLAGDQTRCIGVGCTATIATDYAKRGDHACHVAVHDGRSTRNLGLILLKGARDRTAEEAIVAQMVIRAIAQAVGVDDPPPLALMEGESLHESTFLETDPVRLLLHAAARWVTVHTNGRRVIEEPWDGVIFSGSFNPLHEGHLGLAEAAAKAIGRSLAFELPVVNADKPPLTEAEIARRLAQFHGRHTVLLTREPLFVAKAALFPDCIFAIGHDTAERLLDPRYYGSESARDAALAEIETHGCRFIVAGRARGGVFHTLDDLKVPSAFKDLLLALPDFRNDISSSAIRAQR